MQHDPTLLEQRWNMALQCAGFGVWDLDPQRGLVHYSPQWKAMLGYEPGDEPEPTLVWRERVHPDDLQPMLEALSAHLDGAADAYEMEFRLRAANGRYRWVLSRGRVVERDAAGHALRMVGTLSDQTARHEAQTMRRARDRAEAANQAKTEFLSRMSHELRTPLNAVLGFAQLLAAKAGRIGVEEQRRYLGNIEQAGWHLLAMINDVLDLSMVESGQLRMQIGPVALAPLVGAVGEMMGPMATEHAVQVRVAPVAPQATVWADPERLRQVLTNLVSNAIKYNRPGGRVDIDVRADGGHWVLRVADTGLGIPAAQMPHLFEPFNRLGRAGSAVEGVGIGLVLSRWLVDKMGGRVEVESTEGEGSVFTVSLAAADAADATDLPAARPAGQALPA